MRELLCDPNAEVIGQSINSYLDNLKQSSVFPIMEKHDLMDTQIGEWYPLQNWLNVLND